MIVKRGIIKSVSGSWESSIATLTFKDGNVVHADNGPLFRNLEAAFGNVISRGHCAQGVGHIGQDIVYWMDDMGLCMGAFVPIDKWLDRGLPAPKVGGKLEFEPEDYARDEC